MVFVIDVDDFCFNFFVFFQCVVCVFNMVMVDFRGFQDSFNFVVQGDGCCFGVYCRNSVFNDGVFVVQLYKFGEWIVFELFDVQGNVFVFWINRQDNGFNFVIFFVFMNCFFVSFVLVDVGQVNQVVDVVVQVDEDIEVSD